MQWINALSTRSSLEAAITEVVDRVTSSLSGDLDVGILFISSAFVSDYARLLPLLLEKLPLPLLLGCGGSGIVGVNSLGRVQEIEGEPALSLTVAQLPGVKLSPFHLPPNQLPDPDSPPQKWIDAVGVDPQDNPQFILLADDFSARINDLIEGLDFAYPGSVKVGGLASTPTMGKQSGLFFYSDQMPDYPRAPQGTIGFALSGNLVLETIVAQGCRPIGSPYRIQESERNIIISVEGLEEPNPRSQPPMVAIQDILGKLSYKEKELAQNSLFIGIARDAFQLQPQPRDFLVRNLLGVDPRSGAIAVGDRIRPGQRIQFHLRDAQTSAEDLESLLADFVREKADVPPGSGCLMFACLGRGEGLYGQADVDSGAFRRWFPQISLSGFFCNGEIGPVGGQTYLHGYTSAFAIVRPAE
jgi:small ligand-binding sensory domain FIST